MLRRLALPPWLRPHACSSGPRRSFILGMWSSRRGGGPWHRDHPSSSTEAARAAETPGSILLSCRSSSARRRREANRRSTMQMLFLYAYKVFEEIPRRLTGSFCIRTCICRCYVKRPKM
uniref:Uncharacterized protein n=1 Tax=Triticum urartu TaxID=4572 RepID=A0A8R7UT39_TRIUA